MGWVGPYKVLQKITDVTYKIQESPNSRQIVVHVDHLKPYHGTVPTVWLEKRDSDSDVDENYDTQAPDLSISEQEIGPDDANVSVRELPRTPSPKKSRCGRAIRKPVKYSPQLCK